MCPKHKILCRATIKLNWLLQWWPHVSKYGFKEKNTHKPTEMLCHCKNKSRTQHQFTIIIFAGHSLGKLQEIANIIIVLGKILKKEGLNKEVRNITEWGGVERFSCLYHNKVLYCLVRLKNPFHINSDSELFYWKQLLGNFYFINQNHASYIQYAHNKVIGSAWIDVWQPLLLSPSFWKLEWVSNL